MSLSEGEEEGRGEGGKGGGEEVATKTLKETEKEDPLSKLLKVHNNKCHMTLDTGDLD